MTGGTRATAPVVPARFAAVFGDWTPTAVVFDCDGLLLDTESVWQRAQDAVVGRVGAQLEESDDALLHGATIEDAARIIAARVPDAPAASDTADAADDSAGSLEERVLADLRTAFDAELGDGMRTMPGALAVVRAAAARRPIGCASNSWLESLDEKLVAGGLREHFTVLEASDTVARPKPAPDMYAAAARALGAEPGDALALEDSGTGAQAARSAGLRLLVVPAPGAAGPAPEGDLVLGSLEDPDLLEWIATW
ncbi:HAD family hydrolase [Brachybacterium sp. DNPG3]